MMPIPEITMNKPDAPKCGALSSDDPLWVTECDLDQVLALIYDPQQWIRDLSEAAKRKPGEEIRLETPFVMRIQLLDTVFGTGSKPYVVEGIDGTSVITIRPMRHDSIPSILDLQQHWLDWTGGKIPISPHQWPDRWKLHAVSWADATLKFPVATVGDIAFAHFEITDTADMGNVALQADKILSFITQGLMSQGELFNQILARPADILLPGELGQLTARNASSGSNLFENIDRDSISDITFIYTGNGQPSNDTACNNLAACLNSNSNKYKVDSMTVKSYAVKPKSPVSV